MAYIRIKGIQGLINVPDDDGPKKHNCKECFTCQWCPDTRCTTCLKSKSCKNKQAKNTKAR